MYMSFMIRNTSLWINAKIEWGKKKKKKIKHQGCIKGSLTLFLKATFRFSTKFTVGLDYICCPVFYLLNSVKCACPSIEFHMQLYTTTKKVICGDSMSSQIGDYSRTSCELLFHNRFFCYCSNILKYLQ